MAEWVGCATFSLFLCVCLAHATRTTSRPGLIPSRQLLGEEGELGTRITRYMGIPQGSRLLYQSQANCGFPPDPSVGPNIGLLCQLFENTRSCMNSPATAPIFVGRNCTGSTCILELVPGPAECLLEAYGIPVDLKNETRKATCGLDPVDADYLTPQPNPTSLAADMMIACTSPVSSNVKPLVWVECIEGMPHFKQILKFNRTLSRKAYTCIILNLCEGLHLQTSVACFIPNDGTDATQASASTLTSMGGVAESSQNFGTRSAQCTFLLLLAVSAVVHILTL